MVPPYFLGLVSLKLCHFNDFRISLSLLKNCLPHDCSCQCPYGSRYYMLISNDNTDKCQSTLRFGLDQELQKFENLIPHFKEGRDIFVHCSQPTMAR